MEGCKIWLGFFIELYFFGCKILVEDVTTMSRYDFRPGISDEVPLARRRRLRLWGGDGSVREECNGGNEEYGGEGGDGGAPRNRPLNPCGYYGANLDSQVDEVPPPSSSSRGA